MSVVVRMEMPKNCINCDLRYECNAFYVPGKPKPFMKGCRIVCQLPEGHGRLVEAKALFERVYEYYGQDNESNENWMMEMINGAPTIVPADMSWETSTYCPRCGAKMEVHG